MSALVKGVDFAHGQAAVGTCWLREDAGALTILAEEPPGLPALTAVDSPLGTTVGFEECLRGGVPDDDGADGFKSRHTERWLRRVISEYQSTQSTRNGRSRLQRHRGLAYFSSPSHVRGSVQMETVPEAIRQALELLQAENNEGRLALLHQARMGAGPVVEAHPRAFLYSALERITRQGARPLSARLLREISLCKVSDVLKGTRARRLALLTLRARPQWQGPDPLPLEFSQTVHAAILADHHFFDAFLAACTAWCHLRGQTVSWQQAGIPEAVVHIEGHILVLRQDEEHRND